MATGGETPEYTGERMVPAHAHAVTFWEHVERYRFALPHVVGRSVLDVACGDGYGSAAMMRAGAAAVIGVDISPDACEHARAHYGVDARPGSAEHIPLDDGSVDAVVSFETIEHVPDPATFVREAGRVLRPGGLFIVSTPNKAVYNYHTPNNPFHCSEMTVGEFCRTLSTSFEAPRLFGQCAPEPAYLRRRGVGRLFRLLRAATSPETASPLDRRMREKVVELTLRPRRPLEKVTNPWLVKEASGQVLQSCCYIVAVTTKAPH